MWGFFDYLFLILFSLLCLLGIVLGCYFVFIELSEPFIIRWLVSCFLSLMILLCYILIIDLHFDIF